MISIFYLPIRYCSLKLQKTVVRFSHENVRMHHVFCAKMYPRVLRHKRPSKQNLVPSPGDRFMDF